MKDLQSVMGQVVNESLGMQKPQERKPSAPYSDSTIKLVILTFTRMADLFGSKASNRGFVIYQDEAKGIYSEALDLWCRKLNELTTENFKTGMDGLEKRAEDSYKNGEEMWPPSYAEFRALCFPKNDRDSAAHKVLEHVLLAPIESPEEKEKRLELGRKEAARLLGMFDEPEPVKEIDNSLSKQRLQEAMEKLKC